MSDKQIIKCPACGEKLQLTSPPSWNSGFARCPACRKRVFLSLKENKKPQPQRR